MSEPVTIGRATLYLGDCRDILPTLPKVDAVVTDPPYPDLQGGIVLKSSKRGGSGVGRDAGETVGDPWQASLDWLPAAWAACRLGLMTFCTHHSLSQIERRLIEVGAEYLGFTTWDKPNAPYPARNVPRLSSEYVMRFRKEPGLEWRHLKDSVITMSGLQAGCMASPERVLEEGSKKAAHPAQKPLALMQRLLAVRPGSVCDPFMGTGTTGVAALSFGIDLIGVEKDPKYFEIACRRIEDAQRQVGLFDEAAA